MVFVLSLFTIAGVVVAIALVVRVFGSTVSTVVVVGVSVRL